MQESVGSIELILGPMFSGKSSELIKLIRRYNIKRRKTIVVKFNLDNRYDNSQSNVVTHDQFTYPALKCGNLFEIKETLLKYEVIGIDEGQFFPDLAIMCEELANRGKHIVISALNANYKRESFPSITEIFPKAEKIIYLQSICYYCNDDAPFTLRTISNEEEVLIGGLESYKPVCRNCYNMQTEKDSSSEEDKTEVKDQEFTMNPISV